MHSGLNPVIVCMRMRSFVVPTLVLLAVVNGREAAAEELWWPQFRGPGARGVAQAGMYPVHFGADVNLIWKTPLPKLEIGDSHLFLLF